MEYYSKKIKAHHKKKKKVTIYFKMSLLHVAIIITINYA